MSTASLESNAFLILHFIIVQNQGANTFTSVINVTLRKYLIIFFWHRIGTYYVVLLTHIASDLIIYLGVYRYTCWHSFSFCFGTYVLWSMAMTESNPGWTRLLFRDFNVIWYWFPTPAESQLGNLGWPTFPMTPLVKYYYLTELAFWMSCVFFLYVETIRDDFYALLLHHNITCLSILISYCLSLWRIGIVILLVHDVADIVLYTAKTVYYYGRYKRLVDMLFGVFAITFFASRLVIFPLLCVRPVVDLSNIRMWSNGVIQNHWEIPGAVILSCFLCILQMLHIFWFVYIMKMIIKTYSGIQVSKMGDIRSDAESEASQHKDFSSDKRRLSLDENESEDEDDDQRMKLSSLPGVRPTLTKRQVKASQK